ncbi:AlpA family transcriptional regulator [Methylobacterium sp. NEAU K]|uniref:helix-turn-helix transcriptional regulator n=1 Tax=Methylobacterium sp. NEAU K TaxID=3064946 RepID=UPI0027345213|nr:excisionase family DNA-binding protein [Methylobacterium sp. NEAU K]MDP4005125.1 excisionase family DNA-binding protein [Methylobacterium sp. NEAU K]
MPRSARAQERPERLALPFAPKGLSRLEAARYVGVSTTTFDEMVRERLMPRPKLVGTRVLWDRAQIDLFFEALPEREASQESDEEILERLG